MQIGQPFRSDKPEENSFAWKCFRFVMIFSDTMALSRRVRLGLEGSATGMIGARVAIAHQTEKEETR